MSAIYVVQVNAIVLHSNDVQPCCYVSHGIRKASIDQSARFKLKLTWSYTNGGTTYNSSSTVNLSAMTFHQTIDPRTDDVHTTLSTRGACDAGTNVTVTAQMIYTDNAGVDIDVSDVESKTIVA